jgi:hypothetical protein
MWHENNVPVKENILNRLCIAYKEFSRVFIIFILIPAFLPGMERSMAVIIQRMQNFLW